MATEGDVHEPAPGAAAVTPGAVVRLRKAKRAGAAMYGWGDLADPRTRAECALVKGVGADGNVKLCFARCAAWSPVPLVPEGSVYKPELVVAEACGATLKLKGDSRAYVNFTSHNFLGLVGEQEVHSLILFLIEKLF